VSHKRSEVSKFLIAIILFIVAVIILIFIVLFYYKGGVSIFENVSEKANISNIASKI